MGNAGIIGRSARNPRANKRKNPPKNLPPKAGEIRIVSASAALSALTVEFNEAVGLSGVPQYTTDVAGALAVSATVVNPSTIQITFDNSIAAATSIIIPYQDPAVRNTGGGFVADSTFTL